MGIMPSEQVLSGEKLRAAREAAGLTQAQLAVAVGLAGGERISEWERGASSPRTPELLHRVARACHVRPSALLRDDPSPQVDLRWLRFSAGVTLDEVAEAADTPPPTVRRWERHGLPASLSPQVARSLAEVLGVELEALRPTQVAAEQ